mgnify:CR=1 FL=1
MSPDGRRPTTSSSPSQWQIRLGAAIAPHQAGAPLVATAICFQEPTRGILPSAAALTDVETEIQPTVGFSLRSSRCDQSHFQDGERKSQDLKLAGGDQRAPTACSRLAPNGI